MSSLPRPWRLLALAGPPVAFVALLVTGELWVRWTQDPVSSLELFVRSERQQADFTDRRSVSIFEGDPLLFWRLRANLRDVIWDFTLVSTNAQGQRGTHPLGAKRPGSVRIVCLGDSVTFGYRVPVIFAGRPEQYDRQAQPYPMLLEQRLRAANPGQDIEVVMLAVPGYSSHQGRAWLAREAARLQPDLVTACFGWNDIGLRAASDSTVMTSSWHTVVARGLLSRSQALAHLSLALERARSGGRRPPLTVPRVSREEYVANHLAIVDLARGQGSRAVIIGPVYRDAVEAPEEAARLTAHRAALAGRARAEGIAYLEIPQLMESAHPGNQAFFGERIHPNYRGHRLMADALLELLEAGGILDGLGLRPPAD